MLDCHPYGDLNFPGVRDESRITRIHTKAHGDAPHRESSSGSLLKMASSGGSALT
jgi:hypothetical protein